MAEAGDQGQRHGVGDFSADQAAGRQHRIENEQGHGAQCTGADGRQRDHGAEDQASDDRQDIEARAAGVVVAASTFVGEIQQTLLEQNRQRRGE
ncbi:hypothetical protein D3C87_1878770 [compost metagenome]